MKKAVVFLADGFEEVEAITPIDFLRRANIEVITAGISGKDIVGGHDIRVTADITLDEFDTEVDAVVVPGGTKGAENIAASEEAKKLIRRTFGEGKLVAAICAAPALVLSKTGVLEGKTFTCYPGFEERVKTGTFTEDRVCVDGNLITSRGPGTAAEFAVAVISYLLNEEEGQKVHKRTLQK